MKKPQDWIDLWIEEITMFIDSVSFFNNKSKNIYKTCSILVEKYDSQIPKNYRRINRTSLSGNIKTAKVFLAVVEDAPYIWVDTHVHRVLNRLWIVNTKSPNETDKKLVKKFSKQNHSMLHNTLVLFWRYHCMARKPKCEECKFQKICNIYKKTQ